MIYNFSQWNIRSNNLTIVCGNSFFNEFTLRLPRPAHEVVEALAEQGVLAGVPVSRLLPDHKAGKTLLLVAVTEMNMPEERTALKVALEEALS